MSVETAIQVNGLSKTYTEGLIFRKRFRALNNVSFEVPKGKIFGLLGPNGAGKTTFLKILLGVIRKSGGNATMLGHPAGSRSGRAKVGYLPERLRIPLHMTGHNALECFGNLSNVPTSVIKQKRDALMELVGLRGREKDKVKKYSKGMQQRLGLAQALLNDPELLVLDEPTDGLDPQARAEMRGIIRRLKDDGVTIFLNSHILQEVELICDNVAILDKGNLRYCGLVESIGDFVKSEAGNSAQGHQVKFQVNGNEETVQKLIQELDGKVVNDGPATDTIVFTASFADQAAVDRAVDRVRASQISLIGLSTEKFTLEEAFLKIVGGTKDESLTENQHLFDTIQK